MYHAQQVAGQWQVASDQPGEVITWMGDRPRTQAACNDAAARLNAASTTVELPWYARDRSTQTVCSYGSIVAAAPWGDTYTGEDAENGCVPLEAYDINFD